MKKIFGLLVLVLSLTLLIRCESNDDDMVMGQKQRYDGQGTPSAITNKSLADCNIDITVNNGEAVINGDLHLDSCDIDYLPSGTNLTINGNLTGNGTITLNGGGTITVNNIIGADVDKKLNIILNGNGGDLSICANSISNAYLETNGGCYEIQTILDNVEFKNNTKPCSTLGTDDDNYGWNNVGGPKLYNTNQIGKQWTSDKDGKIYRIKAVE